ncbi:phospholipase D-like domain-containing protein [Pseudomonas saudiphocaensis]|uniref:phospholipase D-like domain-containing protein n=1 Tax=Pseudomonas saudiphocaensis TaxID=1499686 RepID=UPI000F7897D2|nr:phosphatidylserine/phosphatidylglycerophosphate/cardiolipin synthase family protein [Pseudomonas saudiphocaensis]RRV14585.1 phosphatidylserine/phosphatidylglycerophosphate/cardiolipin synthase family protein [Pseudomonas saudiphocaensis]
MLAGEVFPWREDNKFQLLVDGPQFFPRLLQCIDAAERRVDVELYLVEDGQCAERLVDALVAAAVRGVRVRCLFDGFGCLKLGQKTRQRLIDGNVELRLYNPLNLRLKFRNLHRDHRKLILIDDTCCFVGGTGVTDEFWNPEKPDEHWHEVMVEISGPLMNDWRRLFDAQWTLCLKKRIWQFPLPQRLPKIPETPELGNGMGRVAYSAARQHRDILHSLIRNLQRAHTRIWLATPYFLPTGRVRRELLRAVRRGVEVRLLLTSRNTDHPPIRYAGQRYYPRLLRAGVRIHEYQPHFLHLKMVLIDDWVSIGSCNFDHWNLRWNLEANLEAVDACLSASVAESFEQDFSRSKEIDLRIWNARPLRMRIHQRLWGLLDRLAINIFNRSG